MDVEISESGTEPLVEPEADVTVAGPRQVHVQDDFLSRDVLVDLDAPDVGRDLAQGGAREVDILHEALLLS